MKAKKAVLLVLSVFTALGTLAADCQAAPAKAATPQGFPKVMTGLDTKVSVQILRCVRAHVPGFGQNQVVVLQYRLRKEGANPSGAPPYDKDKWYPREIKARDPVLSQAFEVWQPTSGNETYSKNKWTDEMKPGESGDGYVWLNIPDRVNLVDVYFPYTNPQRVKIEVPKA
jgi:hypothetical protein